MTVDVDVVDLFSGGGGGWCLAARAVGLTSVGIEMDGASCRTRAAVGLLTIRADVATYPPERFAGVVGLTGSPPCQSFSSAGKRRGMADPRGQLVHEPMRWVRAIGPRWVALEQVPEVLGCWRWTAQEMRSLGYSVWTGILNAADYGVPQVRKRAILLASLDRQVQPPEPTHSKTGHAAMFGPDLLPWVTMAEALGWGLTERPAYVIAASSTNSGTHDGGSRQREQIAKHQAEGRWKLRTDNFTSGAGRGHPEVRAGARPAPPRPCPPGGVCGVSTGRQQSGGVPVRLVGQNEPSPAVTTSPSQWCWERPATTVMGDQRVFPPGGHHPESGDAKSWSSQSIPVTIAELGVLQGFPADHPWQAPGRSGQVGNAIPPPLAEACLRAVTGSTSNARRPEGSAGVDPA